MRALAALLIALFLTWPAAAQTKHPRRAAPAEAGEQRSHEAEDRAAIQKLQERDIAASIAYDVEGLMSLWTDDGVLMVPQRAPIVGRQGLRAFYEQQRDQMANVEVLAYEEQWQEVRILGDYAYEWGQIHGRTRKGQGKAESDVVVNAMRILKRDEDGNWKVARAIWNEARAGTSVGAEPKPAGEQPQPERDLPKPE